MCETKKSIYNAKFVIACDVVRIVEACTTEDGDHSWSSSHNDLVVRIEECIFLFMPTVQMVDTGVFLFSLELRSVQLAAF